MGDSISGRLSEREPNSKDYPEMNGHLSRVQSVLREGTSRTDIGILHLRYGENTAYPDSNMNALRKHDGLIWQDLELQFAGYTYDYFSPEHLKLMSYNEEGLGENVRYQALIVHQEGLALNDAEILLGLAKEGLPVIFLTESATYSPYYADDDAKLAAVVAEMKKLDNVVTIAAEADAKEALEAMGITPRAELVGGNPQLLSQLRQDGDKQYLFLYNYCDGTACGLHGEDTVQEVSVDGIVIPYHIDSWTGNVEKVANYRYENGRTVFTVDMAYCTVELYAFEPAAEEEVHVVDATADVYVEADGSYVLRTAESGEHTVTMSNGTSYNFNVTVPAAQNLTGWDLVVEDWQAGEAINRTETGTYKVMLADGTFVQKEVTTVEEKITTAKTEIAVKLDELTTWNNIPEVGKEVSGIGTYTTTFNWDADAADGAYLDLGWISQSAEVEVNGVVADPVDIHDPIVNIGDLLVDGENTLKIVVTAPLTNRLLAMGRLREGVSGTHRFYTIKYHENGLSSVTLIPYVEEAVAVVESGEVVLTVTGADEVTVEAEEVAFEVAVSGAENLATATLTVETEGLVDPAIVPAEGWTVYIQTVEDGVLTVVMGNNAGVTGEAVIATVVGGNPGKVGAASAVVTEATLSAFAGETETFVAAVLDNAAAETVVTYSKYDVNQDGTVNQLDITRAQRFFGQSNDLADVNDDGEVDVTDFVLILNNYSK